MRKGVVFVYLGWIGGHIIIFVIRGGVPFTVFVLKGAHFHFLYFLFRPPFFRTYNNTPLFR